MSVEANHRVRQVRRRKSVASTDALFQMISDVRIRVGNPNLLASIQSVHAGQTAARSHDFRVGGCL